MIKTSCFVLNESMLLSSDPPEEGAISGLHDRRKSVVFVSVHSLPNSSPGGLDCELLSLPKIELGQSWCGIWESWKPRSGPLVLFFGRTSSSLIASFSPSFCISAHEPLLWLWIALPHQLCLSNFASATEPGRHTVMFVFMLFSPTADRISQTFIVLN